MMLSMPRRLLSLTLTTTEAPMPQREPSAAQALFGHLPSANPAEQLRRSAPPSPADAIYPSLTPQRLPGGWHAENISLVRRAFAQGLSDAEVARRYNVSKQVIGQIRKSM
jgi:hypothetical protein